MARAPSSRGHIFSCELAVIWTPYTPQPGVQTGWPGGPWVRVHGCILPVLCSLKLFLRLPLEMLQALPRWPEDGRLWRDRCCKVADSSDQELFIHQQNKARHIQPPWASVDSVEWPLSLGSQCSLPVEHSSPGVAVALEEGIFPAECMGCSRTRMKGMASRVTRDFLERSVAALGSLKYGAPP